VLTAHVLSWPLLRSMTLTGVLALADVSCCEGGIAISPDKKIQAMIRQFANAKDPDDLDARTAMKGLTKLARSAPEVLAPQLVYYSMRADSGKGLGSLELMGHFTPRWGLHLRKGLIPLLEARDTKIKREASDWLAVIDNYDNSLSRDQDNVLAVYKPLFAGKKAMPPPGLVDYVFTFNPRKALLLLGEVYLEKAGPRVAELRALVWADHVIHTAKWRIENQFLQKGDLAKAQKEIDSLSKHEGWYARRYVVEIMRDDPELGAPEILERLKKDLNPLVSEAAKSVK